MIDNLDATDIPDHSNVERVAAILGTFAFYKQARNPGTNFKWDTGALCETISE